MNYASDPKLTKALNQAKIGLFQKSDSAFFAHIFFSMKFVWDDTHSTAWTTGLKVGFNPQFFMSMTPGQRIGVMVHECCHPAFLHMARTGNRDHDLFNVAADHAINLMLLDRGFELPSFAFADKRFAGMSTEEIYNILEAEKQQGAPTPSNGMPDIRQPGDGEEGEAKMDNAAYKNAIEDIIIRAKVHSQMSNDKPGTIPGEIEMYLDRLLNPKLPWQTILRKYLKEMAKHDYSWKRPNRRFMPDHYLPSLWSEGAMMDFQAWVDISGSETDEDFLRFISELDGILRMMKPKKIELGQFDTSIKSIDVVRNIVDLVNVKFTGRGGTNITAVLDHIEKTKPKLAMIFSDGGFYHDREHCSTNVLWMIHDNPNWTAPFGRVIHYETHNK